MTRIFRSLLPFLTLVVLATRCRTIARSVPADSVRDVDGNTYKTVTVGSQDWLAENLRVTRTPEGVPLSTVSPNNDASLVPTFGRLYDWEAAHRACPAGWHLPSDAEWSALDGYLGSTTGLLLRDPGYWPNQDPGAAARVSFGALPAGYSNDQGFETFFGTRAVFWTDTPQDSHFVWSRVIDTESTSLRRAPQHPQYGFSVRCLSALQPASRP
jgi:uncharacterized protein (TIGR02145 family)